MTSLKTSRLLLTPFSPDDEDGLLMVFQDPGVRRYLLDDQVVQRDWVQTEIAASRERFSAGSLGLWCISQPPDRSVIGFVGFRPFFDPPELQLLYGLLPEYWGAGLATEAAGATCEYAFEELGSDQVRAAIDAPNHASERVLQRLGFALSRTSDEGEAGTRFFELPRAQYHRRQKGQRT